MLLLPFRLLHSSGKTLSQYLVEIHYQQCSHVQIIMHYSHITIIVFRDL